jgi:uncharacterized protein (TIGR02646 family)
MRNKFSGLCGYCEEACKGEVDHFRPKSLYPSKVYSWGNWIYACHTCNNAKGEKWLKGGYINPCATKVREQPETFFTFDITTGEILPKSGLAVRNFDKASDMTCHLKLNSIHHLKKRKYWLAVLEHALAKNNISASSVRLNLE